VLYYSPAFIIAECLQLLLVWPTSCTCIIWTNFINFLSCAFLTRVVMKPYEEGKKVWLALRIITVHISLPYHSALLWYNKAHLLTIVICCYISETESHECACGIILKEFRICFNYNGILVDLHYVGNDTINQACKNASNVASILTSVVMAEEKLFKYVRGKVHCENNCHNASRIFDCDL
jgi:hypothetical protein